MVYFNIPYHRDWPMFTLLNDGQIIERIAKGCRAKRTQLKMTQEELAKRSNLALPTIKKFERGEPASLKTLIAIMRALGEVQRFEELLIEIDESPREIFLQQRNNKKVLL